MHCVANCCRPIDRPIKTHTIRSTDQRPRQLFDRRATQQLLALFGRRYSGAELPTRATLAKGAFHKKEHGAPPSFLERTRRASLRENERRLRRDAFERSRMLKNL